MGHAFSKYSSVGAVLEEAARLLPPEPRSETIEVARAFGRVPSSELRASDGVPKHDTSHMDGFAIGASETRGASRARPVRFKVVGRAAVGVMPSPEISGREAVRVATGSYLPRGADSVVPLEEVTLTEGGVEVRRPTKEGSFVFRAGSDVALGEVIIRRGTPIRAQEIGMLLATGIRAVRVFTIPSVGLLATGSELTDSSVNRRGKVVNSHVPILTHLLRANGFAAVDFGIVPDDPAKVLAALRRALEGSDLILTTGGTSVGDLDLVEDVIAELRPAMVRHGVMMDRGRVAGVAVVGTKVIVMLPGPAQGAMNAFLVLALPLLKRLAGRADGGFRVHATLTGGWRAREKFAGFTKVLYLKLFEGKSGAVAEPIVGATESMSVLTRANAYTVIAEGVTLLRAGDSVDASLLPGFSFAG